MKALNSQCLLQHGGTSEANLKELLSSKLVFSLSQPKTSASVQLEIHLNSTSVPRLYNLRARSCTMVNGG